MSYIVKLHDLDDYPEGTVLATDAPVVDSTIVETFAEAFEFALVLGEDYQVTIEPVGETEPVIRFAEGALS